MTEIIVRGVTFTIDEEDLTLLEGASLRIRRGGHNREHHRYLYARWGGVGKPEYSVARLILGLGHNDRTILARISGLCLPLNRCGIVKEVEMPNDVSTVTCVPRIFVSSPLVVAATASVVAVRQ
jgi:hypothetical protein